MYPAVGKDVALVKGIVVAVLLSAPFKVVDNYKIVITTPPTGFLTS